MSDPTSTPAGADALPPDERMRQCGSKLLLAISATLRVGRAYAPQNQVFVNQLDGLLAAVRAVLEHQPEAVIVAHDSDVYLNGVRVPVNHASFRFQQTVIELFARLRIAGLRFTSAVTRPELSRLFALIVQPDGPVAGDLMEAAAAQALRGAAPILHATLDPAAPSMGEAIAAAVGAAGEPVSVPEPSAESTPEAAGRRRYAQAVHGARLLLMPTSLQTTLEVRRAKRVVQPLIEAVARSEPLLVGLTPLSRRDEYTYAHAVNVCGIAVAIGYCLGLDRRALSDLGVAALLHDVGKAAVAGKIFHDLERFTPEERREASRHPLEGAKLLARATDLSPTTLRCMRVALEHHATGPGGYPALPPGWRPSLLSRIVALADCFVSLQTRVGEDARPKSPTVALAVVLGPLATQFPAALRWALVRAVGFYPTGQIVEMDDGSLATVLAPNAQDPARPHVRIVASKDRSRLAPAEPIELRPIPADRSVARALELDEYPEGALEAVTGTARAA